MLEENEPTQTPEPEQEPETSSGLSDNDASLILGAMNRGIENDKPVTDAPKEPESKPDAKPVEPDVPDEEKDDPVLAAFKKKESAATEKAPETPEKPDKAKAEFTAWVKAQAPEITDEQVDATYGKYQLWLDAQSAAQPDAAAPVQPPATPPQPAIAPTPEEIEEALMAGGKEFQGVLERHASVLDARIQEREAAMLKSVTEHVNESMRAVSSMAELMVHVALATRNMPEVYENSEAMQAAIGLAMKESSDPREIATKAAERFQKGYGIFTRATKEPNRIDVRKPSETPTPLRAAAPAKESLVEDDASGLGFLAGMLNKAWKDR